MENKKLLTFGFILGASLIIGTAIIAWSLITIKASVDQISVSGSDRQRVTSDSVKWTGSFSRIVLKSEINNGYVQMKKDEADLTKFLKNNGVKDEEINIYPVFMNEVYKNDQNAPREYTLNQTVEVRSSEVEKIKNLAKNIQPLIDKGVFFSTNALEYYYTKLADMRISMLPEAIKDAKARADKIAEGSGKQIKSIKTVDMGVVQVLSPNSVDISDYGNYDTSSVEKEIMITVKVIFNLK